MVPLSQTEAQCPVTQLVSGRARPTLVGTVTAVTTPRRCGEPFAWLPCFTLQTLLRGRCCFPPHFADGETEAREAAAETGAEAGQPGAEPGRGAATRDRGRLFSVAEPVMSQTRPALSLDRAVCLPSALGAAGCRPAWLGARPPQPRGALSGSLDCTLWSSRSNY